MPLDQPPNPLTSTVEESIAAAESYLRATTLPVPPEDAHGQSTQGEMSSNGHVNASLHSTDSIGNGDDIPDNTGMSDDSIDGEEGEDDNIYYASDINKDEQRNVAWTVNFGGGGGRKPELKSAEGGHSAETKHQQGQKQHQQQQQQHQQQQRAQKDVLHPPPPPTRNLSRPAKESLEAVESENTFRPKITTKGRKFQANSRVHDRLVKYGEDKGRAREEMGREREKEMAKKRAEEHPFQPKVTRKGSNIRGNDVEGTTERLYKLAGERDMIRECTKYHMMEAEARNHSFKPQLNPSLPSDHVPIHLRASSVIAQKQEKLNALRSSLHGGDGNGHAAGGDGGGNKAKEDRVVDTAAHQRLHSEAARQAAKNVELLSKYEEEQKTVNTFKPHLCQGSERMVSSYKNKPFLSRQADRAALLNEKKNRIEEEAVRGYRNMFKPRVGKKNEEVLMKSRPEVVCEGEKERVERLSREDAERIRDKKERMQNEAYSKYNYQPSLNNISRALAPKPSTVDELVNNERGVNVRDKARREMERRVKEECTFRPKLSSSVPKFVRDGVKDGSDRALVRSMGSVDLSNPGGITVGLKRYEDMKEERRESIRREREVKECEECTFKPKINRRRGGGGGRNGGGNVVVRGLGRYMELRNIARVKGEEAERREREAFTVNLGRDGGRYPDGTTVVKEFRLSKGREGYKDKLRMEREERIRRECTFKPETVEKRNRKVLEGILNYEEEERGRGGRERGREEEEKWGLVL